MDSHKTDSPRPEPWYEVHANSVFKLLNARASGEHLYIFIVSVDGRVDLLTDLS